MAKEYRITVGGDILNDVYTSQKAARDAAKNFVKAGLNGVTINEQLSKSRTVTKGKKTSSEGFEFKDPTGDPTPGQIKVFKTQAALAAVREALGDEDALYWDNGKGTKYPNRKEMSDIIDALMKANGSK